MTTWRKWEAMAVIDALYVLGSVGFFGLMLAYVRWCERLGRRTGQADEEQKP